MNGWMDGYTREFIDWHFLFKFEICIKPDYNFTMWFHSSSVETCRTINCTYLNVCIVGYSYHLPIRTSNTRIIHLHICTGSPIIYGAVFHCDGDTTNVGKLPWTSCIRQTLSLVICFGSLSFNMYIINSYDAFTAIDSSVISHKIVMKPYIV